MLQVETHPRHLGEQMFTVELPCSYVTQAVGPGEQPEGSRIRIAVPANMLQAIASIMSKASEDSLCGREAPEVVELLTQRLVAALPDGIEPAVQITALASALVTVWESGIFGDSRFELGSTMNHIQGVLMGLAEKGPGHYRRTTVRRGTVTRG